MAKQPAKTEAPLATPPAEEVNTTITPALPPSEPQGNDGEPQTPPAEPRTFDKPDDNDEPNTPPAAPESNDDQSGQVVEPVAEPTLKERLKDLADNSPYIEQQQFAMEALSKLRTAEMWQATADMWADLAINFK